jgi:hypothetical protein
MPPSGRWSSFNRDTIGLPIKPGRLVVDEREAALIREAVHASLSTEDNGQGLCGPCHMVKIRLERQRGYSSESIALWDYPALRRCRIG